MQWRPKPRDDAIRFYKGAEGESKHSEVYEPPISLQNFLVCPVGTTPFKETELEISTHRLIVSSHRL